MALACGLHHALSTFSGSAGEVVVMQMLRARRLVGLCLELRSEP